ncbi:hypothetical protein NEHOM01_2359 [Nematocida homosporus]|uniref:uncharacterized protein n=1 Tax=Nematocida homosporus TaxID=1912981 RepID=UPI00221EEAA0|nr:uncharacterized protein NEHOM01_2359 [Nematocida homosporus]KAI5187778.1 hypothetical protein NEHOM01_2359 [Nematocida homosporus]
MDDFQKKASARTYELSIYQKDQLDAYFYRHNIKLTKKNLKSVSKVLNIPHRRIVDYVNQRQKETHENVHEDYLKMSEALGEINMQIKEIWKRFERA